MEVVEGRLCRYPGYYFHQVPDVVQLFAFFWHCFPLLPALPLHGDCWQKLTQPLTLTQLSLKPMSQQLINRLGPTRGAWLLTTLDMSGWQNHNAILIFPRCLSAVTPFKAVSSSIPARALPMAQHLYRLSMSRLATPVPSSSRLMQTGISGLLSQ